MAIYTPKRRRRHGSLKDYNVGYFAALFASSQDLATRSVSRVLACLVISAYLLVTIAEMEQQSFGGPRDGELFAESILPALNSRPSVKVNIRDWTSRLSEDIRAVSNRTNCLRNIEQFYEKKGEYESVDGAKMLEIILGQINNLLAQHRDAVGAIASEAERLAVAHNFVKELKFNYTDVHRLRNELDPNNITVQDPSLWAQYNDQSLSAGNLGTSGSPSPQFTSINGGTPVPSLPEWQTPIKSIVMQVNKNFGDIPVNTSMSAIHLPLPIYAGLPEIMNGIAWTERLDNVFKRNLANYIHVHHQYYGDHLGFLRTFPAHKWRIPRTDPDLFDARTRPWYVTGASSPKDIVILVDTSGSMTGLRREIAKGVVFEILDTLTINDYFSVLRFSETVTPIGLPKCNIRAPKLGRELEEQCRDPSDQREKAECLKYVLQWENRGQYLRDHPNVVLGKNGSYLTDEVYTKSIFNITQDIRDAYLLPATSRNIRYLKSNFSMPTAGIANFTHALMAAFELLQAYNRTLDLGSKCNQAIMLITDGAIKSHDDIFNRLNYPNSPVRIFSYMIGREVGDITHTKAIACNNRGYYTHVINLSEIREQVQKYLPVLARPMVLGHHHPVSWTNAYGDETYQVLTDWVLEIKRRERARIMLNEERERLNEANMSDVINIELTNLPEYDEIPSVDEELKNRIICEDNGNDDLGALEQSLQDELDPLGYNDLSCHWITRRADLLTSVVKPVFDTRNTTLYFQRVLHKNIWTEQETHVRNAQLLGVAAVDLRVADIIKMAPSYLLGPNGYSVLIGQSGFVMHHPDLRALLEDPFDKQSKILKPYFNSVDLTHIEQVHHLYKNDSELNRRRNDEMKLLKLREALLRRQSGSETLYIKRAIDCRKRLQIRQQVFHFGPIKDTPFSFMIALPQNYGLNRLSAKLELDRLSPSHFKPSNLDLLAVHPDYRYCEAPQVSQQTTTNSLSTILTIMKNIETGTANNIVFDDLASRASANDGRQSGRIVCDKELFPSLLFDAAATHEKPDSICGASSLDCDRPSSIYSSFYASPQDESCANTPEDMRSKLVNIYGLEMSFLATRSGLTRVRVFDLTLRIKKLADLFISRHNRAVDEAWYSRTVDWNMRFHEDASIISAPFNAYVRLVAKLRQRITQRHPAVNDTRANCDPMLDANEDSSSEEANQTLVATVSSESPQRSSPLETSSMINDLGSATLSDEPATSGQSSAVEADQLQQQTKIDYNDYSAYDFLDLLVNSSVHISSTQSIIVRKGKKQRSAVAVTGLLYDYAIFARRFLNSTSLSIQTLGEQAASESATGTAGLPNGQIPGIKIEICPGGECPTKCGYRNDTIDCLLVDNNGFIVVGEELPYIGRPLIDYDENLMQSLVEHRVFHQVQLTDYQAICARNDPPPEQRNAAANAQITSSAVKSLINPLKLDAIQAILANFVASVAWLWSSLYAILLYRSTEFDILFGQQPHLRGSLVGAQSMVSNQSLLALLPNKTFLRPCEKTNTLYETRPIDFYKLGSDSPEYYVSKCGCSAWYVYDAVPKTNLIMLIVNTTSACRKCEPTPTVASNFVPIPLTPLEQASVALKQQALAAIANKTAEDQVCAMLERDSQLYVRKPDTCYSHHPDESQINICGGAQRNEHVVIFLVVPLLLTSLYLISERQRKLA